MRSLSRTQKLQHITFNQPSEPYASSELFSPESNSSSENVYRAIGVPPPPQTVPRLQITFSAWKHAHRVPPPRGRSTCENIYIPPGIVDFPPGGNGFSKKKIPPGGKAPVATVPPNNHQAWVATISAQCEVPPARFRICIASFAAVKVFSGCNALVHCVSALVFATGGGRLASSLCARKNIE